MQLANLADVKNDLSRFVARVRRGARIRILVRGVPAADLVPVETVKGSTEGDESQLAQLEQLGLLRRAARVSRRDEREIERAGPKVRGGRAVEALLAERRSGR